MVAAPGLQVGFGGPIGRATLDALREQGFTIVRLDLQQADLDLGSALCNEVIDAGLQPLCIIRNPDQMDGLHPGALIELGNEPDLEQNGWTVEAYVTVANTCVAKALAMNRRLYLGAVSNLNRRGFSFLQKLPWATYPSTICCSVHRYPEGDDPFKPHQGFSSREDEVAYLRGIVGARPLACSEVGYHDDTQTEYDVAAKMAYERRFFSAQDFEIVVGYQINDGPPGTGSHENHFGFRRLDGTWKPVAQAFLTMLAHPPSNVTTTLRANSGHYVCAEGGGGREVVANRREPGPWETWWVHTYDDDDGRVSLQANTGQFLTAEPDGSVRVRGNRSGEWERFTVEVREDIVAFRSFHGTYLQAPLGGGTDAPMTCVGGDENLPGEWEFFTSSTAFWQEPVTNHNLLSGPLQRDGRVIRDNSGPRILMGCHFMEGFSAYCHGKTLGALDVGTQLEIIAEDYGIVRNLDVLGYWDCNRPGDPDQWSAWKGREVTPIPFTAYSGRHIPATPDYWARKREYVTVLQHLGLRIFDDRGDLNAWTRAQKLGHMYANGQFYNSLPFGKEVLAGLFACNEPWQNGGDDVYLLIDMINAFKEGAGWLPPIVGLGAPGGNSDPAALAAATPPMTWWESEMPDSFLYWSKPPATVITCHGNRGNHANIIEHYFGYGYDEELRDSNLQVENTEPVGPGSGVSVGRVNDPELLCGLTAAAIAGGQGWTFMSGFGVFWDGEIHSMPGYKEVARLPTYLPQDVAEWPVVCHAGTRFRGVRILAAVDPTRAEHYLAADGRFAIVVHTHDRTGNPLPCERDCEDFTVLNMVTGATERSGPLHVGQTYQHAGEARLVVGRLTPQAAQATLPRWFEIIQSGEPRRAGRLGRLRRLFGDGGWSS